MKSIRLIALMGFALAAPAEAARPTYSYVQGAYLHSERSDGSNESQGPRLNLNVSLKRWAYFAGEYDRLDFKGSETTSSATSLGFGVHSLRSNFQLFAVGTYERLDQNSFMAEGTSVASDIQSEGYGVQAGFRVPFSILEFQGDYKYLDYGKDSEGVRADDNRYHALLLGRLTNTTALTASWEKFEKTDVEQWSAGLRFYFKTQYDVRPKKRKPAAAAPAESAQDETGAQ